MGAATRLVGLLTIIVGIIILFKIPIVGLFLGGFLILIGFLLLIPELFIAIIALGCIAIVLLILLLR